MRLYTKLLFLGMAVSPGEVQLRISNFLNIPMRCIFPLEDKKLVHNGVREHVSGSCLKLPLGKLNRVLDSQG